MTTALSFRAGEPSDIGALVALDALCFSSSQSYSDATMSYFVFHPDTRTIVAETSRHAKPGHHGNIAGFIIVHLLNINAGEVVTLDVSPAHRRQQLGSELVRRGELWLIERRARVAFAEVELENEPALIFFARSGYQTGDHYDEQGSLRCLVSKELP